MSDMKLEYIKLYRISLADIVQMTKKMPSAFEILAFFAENMTPNINRISFKNRILSKYMGLSEQQTGRAIRYLVENKFLEKHVFPDIHYRINTAMISKGKEVYAQCYYEPTTICTQEYKDMFYMEKDYVLKFVEVMQRDGSLQVQETMAIKDSGEFKVLT